MSGGLSQFPSRVTTFQNTDGSINSEWYHFLFTQWKKTGGGSSTATVTSAVQKAGDSMTGPLVLSGAPTLAAQAANKAYVDASTGAIAGKVNRSGDTMTGALTLFGPPTVPLHAADKAYVDAETTRATIAEGLLAPLASPTLTGVPLAPTAAPATSTTQLATTAFATTADNLLAPKASPALTGTPTAPTAAPGTNTTQLATTAFDTAAVLVETTRALAAEALLAPKASPSFTGNALVAGGVGVWGHAAPGAQPAAPVTLADVIAIIRGCGLSA